MATNDYLHVAHETPGTYGLHGLTAEDMAMLGEILREQSSRDRHLLAMAHDGELLRAKLALRTQRIEEIARLCNYPNG